jgi:hypothetical protein
MEIDGALARLAMDSHAGSWTLEEITPSKESNPLSGHGRNMLKTGGIFKEGK